MCVLRIFQTSNILRSPPWLGLPLWNICFTNDHRYCLLVVNTLRSFPRSWLITGFATILTRRVPLVEEELLTLPEHLSSPPVFSGVRVARSLVLCICFVDRCLSLSPFSFGHYVFCPSSIYGFWLAIWYLQYILKGLRIFQYWSYSRTSISGTLIAQSKNTFVYSNRTFVFYRFNSKTIHFICFLHELFPFRHCNMVSVLATTMERTYDLRIIFL
jgi:hypothetical protein